jgi:hypothetical protein
MQTYTWGEVEIDRVSTEVSSPASFFGPIAIIAIAVGIWLSLYTDLPFLILALYAGGTFLVAFCALMTFGEEQFSVCGINADTAGIDVIVRYVYHREKRATVDQIHIEWGEVKSLEPMDWSTEDKAGFGVGVRLVNPLKLSKPLDRRMEQLEISWPDDRIKDHPACLVLVEQLNALRETAASRLKGVAA